MAVPFLLHTLSVVLSTVPSAAIPQPSQMISIVSTFGSVWLKINIWRSGVNRPIILMGPITAITPGLAAVHSDYKKRVHWWPPFCSKSRSLRNRCWPGHKGWMTYQDLNFRSKPALRSRLAAGIVRSAFWVSAVQSFRMICHRLFDEISFSYW